MVKLVNRARMSTSTTGTGTITLGSAENGYQSFDDAGVPDGDVVRYVIEDGANWEVGTGTYTASGTTLTRTVTESSNSDAALNLSGNAVVFIGPAAQDFSPTITLAGDASGSVTLTDLEDATLTVTVADDSHNHVIANVDGLQADLDAKLDKSGGTMTGNLILNADPTTALGAATKEYVDTIAAAGIHYHDPVRVEQEGNLTATYDNGTAGVGATLTNNNTQAALVIDGVTMVLNDRVLVYEQTNAFENGIYTVTDVGSASTNWELTRATDADSYGASDPDSLGQGDAFFVQEGNAGAGELYVMNTEGSITFGTTGITFTQIQSTAVYSGGTDITLSGTTFNLDSTISADTTGNAATATALETARTIGGVSFDGSANINLAGVNTTGNQDTSGNAATATAWETARTITLSGDVSGTATGVDGSGNVSITTTVADDSHNHTISNVDGLQTALDAKAPTASPTFSGTITFPAGQTFDGRDVSADGAKLDGIESGATADQTKADIDALGIAASTASTLATARNIALSGDVSGNVNFDGSGNVTITTTIADDSHNHVISNVDGLQTALDGKLSTTGKAADSNLLDGIDSSAFLRSNADDTMTGQLIIDASTDEDLILRGTNPYIRYQEGTSDKAYIQWSNAGYLELRNQEDGSGVRIKDDIEFSQNGSTYYNIWHANNDGSGSGLDADLLDGLQASNFVRSDAADTVTGSITFTGSETKFSNGTYSDPDSGVQRDAKFGSNGIAVNGGVKINGTTDINGNLNAVNNIYLAGTLYHEGDTNTYLTFGTDTITLATGGSNEITVNTTGVRLGDSGNGYFRPVSGQYGSIEIDGGAHTGWEGYSIGGRAVFMHDNSSNMGLYDDVNNHWALRHTFNGTTELYYNDVSKLDTLSNGVSINGNLYTDGSNAEDYDALSGTSPTCNVDNAGAFSLTMTGNTTFTFSGADNNWSQGFILQLTGNGSTVTWPSSVDWSEATAPDAPASGETNIYVFWTRNGGTTWYGVQAVDAAG